MKKMLALLLVGVMSISMVACGGKAESGDKKESSDTLKVDEGLIMVDVTIPADISDDEEPMTQEEVDKTVEEEGYSKGVLNDDGSVTYTMSKKKRKEMLKEYKKSIDEAVDEMLNGEEAVESFQKIEYSDDCSEFDIYVDANTYSDWDSFSGFTFMITGYYYQVFAGEDPETINVVVNYIDNETSEQLNTMSIEDLKEASDEEE